MLTTNTIKVKERLPSPEDEEQVKLTMLSSNKIKPKGFTVKGKGAPPSNDVITTGNMAEYLAQRKKDIVKERIAAKIRQKKLEIEIAANKEKIK